MVCRSLKNACLPEAGIKEQGNHGVRKELTPVDWPLHKHSRPHLPTPWKLKNSLSITGSD